MVESRCSFWAARLLISAVVLASAVAARAFSGKDPLFGNPWYHEDITLEAAKECGWNDSRARANLAWHADYIDSYLYNPLWWVEGGMSRFKVSLATYDELAKLHCDDLFSADHVRCAWLRYLSGALAGLIWASEQNDPSAAQNIVGVSLHAVQDFYAHSSWVDLKERRNRTWFDLTAQERSRVSVWTGAYELPERLGIKHHGKIAPACSILKQSAVSGLMEIGCAGISPLSNSAICRQWKECKQAEVYTPTIRGIRVPANIIYLNPPGIALDNPWLADIGVQVRGIKDATGAEMFETALELAKRSSVHWLRTLEAKMEQLGHGRFWNSVKIYAASGTREREYESYHRFPYTFLSAGPYPPDLRTCHDEYYLRVRLKTATATGSGTDSDVYLHASGKSFLLDYMPRANPLIAYNDLENGDDQVYVVGPFANLPASIALENHSASGGEVLEALGRDFVRAVESLVTSAGDFLLSLVGGHADLIGSSKKVWTAAELAAVGAGGQEFSISVSGGDEGKYKVNGTIRKVREGTDESTGPWAEYSVRLDKLHCSKESKWDRGTNSDEPFVLTMLVPLPGDVQPYRTEAFDDVDSGEDRGIGHTYATVRVPKDYGVLTLPACFMESDDEGKSGRDRLLDKFADRGRNDTDRARRGFIPALGAAIAADWKLAHIDVYAFSRGGPVRTGMVLSSDVNTWIKGKQRKTFTLNTRALRTWPVRAADLEGTAGLVRGTMVRPPKRPPDSGRR